jgi:hypothetical protein
MFDLGRQFGDADGMAFKVTIRPFDMSFAAPSLMTKPTASWHHNRTRIKIKDRVRHYQVWQLGDGHDSGDY